MHFQLQEKTESLETATVQLQFGGGFKNRRSIAVKAFTE